MDAEGNASSDGVRTLSNGSYRDKLLSAVEKTPEISAYGAHWCPDCRRSKQFLGEHQIPYRWFDIEQGKAAVALMIREYMKTH